MHLGGELLLLPSPLCSSLRRFACPSQPNISWSFVRLTALYRSQFERRFAPQAPLQQFLACVPESVRRPSASPGSAWWVIENTPTRLDDADMAWDFVR